MFKNKIQYFLEMCFYSFFKNKKFYFFIKNYIEDFKKFF